MVTTPAVSMLSLHNTANCAIQYIKNLRIAYKQITENKHKKKPHEQTAIKAWLANELLEGKIKGSSHLIQ